MWCCVCVRVLYQLEEWTDGSRVAQIKPTVGLGSMNSLWLGFFFPLQSLLITSKPGFKENLVDARLAMG